MTTHGKRITATVGALALATSLAACGGSSEAGNKKSTGNPAWKKYTFTIGEQSDGIVQLAEESGAFDDAPYTIKWAKFEYGPPLVQAAATGDIDLGNVGSVPPITGAAKDLGFKIVSVQSPLKKHDSSEDIVVPKGSPIKKLADLEGKRVAVPQGSSAHGLALNAIQSVGLTPKDVKFVFLPPAEGQAAFSSGKVDAWSIWDPQASLAVDKGARVIAKGLPPLDYGTSFYVASNKTLEDKVKRAALADVLKRIANSYEFGNDNLDVWSKAYAKETGLELDLVKELIKGWRNKLTYVSDEQVTAEQKLADNFFDAGEITKKVDVPTVVDNILPKGYDVG